MMHTGTTSAGIGTRRVLYVLFLSGCSLRFVFVNHVNHSNISAYVFPQEPTLAVTATDSPGNDNSTTSTTPIRSDAPTFTAAPSIPTAAPTSTISDAPTSTASTSTTNATLLVAAHAQSRKPTAKPSVTAAPLVAAPTFSFRVPIKSNEEVAAMTQTQHQYHASSKPVKIALLFTTGGARCHDTSKLEFVEGIWKQLVASLHYTLVRRPHWHIAVRFTNDGLVPCLNWTRFEQTLLALHTINNNTHNNHHNSTFSPSQQLSTTYISIPANESHGIGQNMNLSYTVLYHQNDADFIVNLEDDLYCRKRWLLELHHLYTSQKAQWQWGNATTTSTSIPLIATGYNSNFTADTIMTELPCTPSCVWKKLVYGPNYFFDNATFHAAVYPAFTSHHRGWGGQDRPAWAASLQAWDNWVLEEYAVALQDYRRRRQQQQLLYPTMGSGTLGVPPGILVTTPSVLRHVERPGSLHVGKHDTAVDFVDSIDEEDYRRHNITHLSFQIRAKNTAPPKAAAAPPAAALRTRQKMSAGVAARKAMPNTTIR